METIKGTIKKIKQDRKGVLLDNEKWYSNNFKSELDVNIGDEVEIEYKVNGNFNNYDKVTVTKKAEKSATQVSNQGYDPTTMLVSYAKDIVVGSKKSMKDALEEVLIAYYRTKQVLGSPDEFLIEHEALITGQEPDDSNKKPEVETEKVK